MHGKCSSLDNSRYKSTPLIRLYFLDRVCLALFMFGELIQIFFFFFMIGLPSYSNTTGQIHIFNSIEATDMGQTKVNLFSP